MENVTVVVAVGDLENSQKWAQVFTTLQPQWNVVCWDEVRGSVSADFAVVWSPSRELFIDQPQLKAIFNIGAGVDGIDFTVIPSTVPVYRIEDGGMAVQMAEYAVYGALLATQRFMPYVAQQQQQHWQHARPVYRQHWPVGVLGYGQIGQKVVQVMQNLGYPVSTWARTQREVEQGVRLFAGNDQLDDFLSQSRLLINVLPLTEETRGLLNAERLAQLPANSFLINMARGGHVVEADLLAALDSGHLVGALLDVFQTEPLPADNPFWTHPKVHITPHIAGVSLREPISEQIAAKIQDFQQGKVVTGLVQRDLMY